MNGIGRKKHIREPPSVPFLWEVKPGIPKKDWKPEMPSVIQFPKTQTPLTLIASVPFVWEEKPGTPLPNFSHSPVDMLIHAASSSSNDNVYQDSSYSDDSESITAMGLETFSFDTDESFGSIPSLLANCIVTSAKVSGAIPLEEGNSSCLHDCDQVEFPLSPTSSETDNSTSSYATGRSSLTGTAFLECLFPLYPPKSGFLERDGDSEAMSSTPVQLEVKAKEFEDQVLYASDMIRRPATLGELIMMSRRRSCRRKALQMKIWDPPKNITRKQAFGCFTFVTGGNMIEGLLKRKYLPRLKLMI